MMMLTAGLPGKDDWRMGVAAEPDELVMSGVSNL
jgi:hypothetical protein